jgi:hypothetical protein
MRHDIKFNFITDFRMCLRDTNLHIHFQILSCERVSYSGTCTNVKLQRRFLFVTDHNKQDNNVSLRVPTTAMYTS